MRVDVSKYLFVGCNKSAFFLACRELGIVEFISEHNFAPSEKGKKFAEGLKILNQLHTEYAEDAQEPTVATQNLTADQVVDEVFSLQRDIVAYTEQIKVLNQEVLRVKPLGQFSSNEVKELTLKTDMPIRFFYCKHVNGNPLEVDIPNMFYLSTAYHYNYYVVIGVVDLPQGVYTEIEAPRSVNELQEELLRMQEEVNKKKARIIELYAYRRNIIESLCEHYNDQRLQHAEDSAQSLFDGKIFHALGWVISDRIQELQQVCSQLNVICERVLENKDEMIPTHLRNQGISKIGEDLVKVYDAPASSDKDPSFWVFISFFFFFSMIVNDAGYGLIFLITSLFFSFKLRQTTSAVFKRFLRMFSLLGFGCIVWGFATSSFFGISLSHTNPIKKYSITHVLALKKAKYYLEHKPKGYQELIQENPVLKNKTTPESFLFTTEAKTGESVGKAFIYDKFIDNVLMELALLIGVIHLTIGMLRYAIQRYSSVGWIIFMIGAYLYLPIYLKAISIIHYVFHVPYVLGGEIGTYMMGFGISFAVLGAIVQRGFKGIDEVTVIIQVFSDVLSYLRIYALGLAGAMVGASVVQMSMNFHPLIAIPILLIGHGVNLVLAIMGGVIHGLRLNFIEWYHYSFDGGGRFLNVLRKEVCIETEKS